MLSGAEVVWVIIADVIAMLCVFALVPLVLSCAKRRSKRLSAAWAGSLGCVSAAASAITGLVKTRLLL